jgi:hypothetical protein
MPLNNIAHRHGLPEMAGGISGRETYSSRALLVPVETGLTMRKHEVREVP